MTKQEILRSDRAFSGPRDFAISARAHATTLSAISSWHWFLSPGTIWHRSRRIPKLYVDGAYVSVARLHQAKNQGLGADWTSATECQPLGLRSAFRIEVFSIDITMVEERGEGQNRFS